MRLDTLVVFASLFLALPLHAQSVAVTGGYTHAHGAGPRTAQAEVILGSAPITRYPVPLLNARAELGGRFVQRQPGAVFLQLTTQLVRVRQVTAVAEFGAQWAPGADDPDPVPQAGLHLGYWMRPRWEFFVAPSRPVDRPAPWATVVGVTWQLRP